MDTVIILLLDLFGTAVFAVTGAIQGVRCKFDIFGVTVLACCVGVGGGIVRDATIGAVPVAALQNEYYLFTCILSGLITFCTARYWIQQRNIIKIFDAVGLGVFAALGAAKGSSCDLGFIGVVLCGVSTAIGGGMIRDVLTNKVPVVLKSDFYATAALIGGVIYYCIHKFELPFLAEFFIVSGTVSAIRLLAIHYKIHLPAAGGKKRRQLH